MFSFCPRRIYTYIYKIYEYILEYIHIQVYINIYHIYLIDYKYSTVGGVYTAQSVFAELNQTGQTNQ